MTTLFVANLAVGTTDDDLKELFGKYGSVASAGVVIDRNTGRSRGFALVDMNDGADAAILAVNGMAVNGRPLSVNAAQPRTTRPSLAAVPWS